ncbi:MAG: hypothetical protein QN168_10510 [Armatimonadota bacterium]|nr:hypothetical protein [Armatimonadota bacterium]
MTTPSVRCAPDLLDAVVGREIDRRRREGDGTLAERYRKAADAIYARCADAASRHAAFCALHARLFEDLGFAQPIRQAVERVGLAVEAILVARAWSHAEEAADLSPDRRTLGLRLLPERFGTPDLIRVLHHELGHVLDVLDPAFAYGATEASARAARRLHSDRFALLWDCAVDGRTARAGLEPLATREERLAAFLRLFPRFGRQAAGIVVDRLWDGARPTYTDLLQFADDPALLAAWAGAVAALESPSGSAAADRAPEPILGAPCPLCGFPTFAWAGVVPEAVVACIAADFPDWSPESGACERCVEGYAVMTDAGGLL